MQWFGGLRFFWNIIKFTFLMYFISDNDYKQHFISKWSKKVITFCLVSLLLFLLVTINVLIWKIFNDWDVLIIEKSMIVIIYIIYFISLVSFLIYVIRSKKTSFVLKSNFKIHLLLTSLLTILTFGYGYFIIKFLGVQELSFFGAFRIITILLFSAMWIPIFWMWFLTFQFLFIYKHNQNKDMKMDIVKINHINEFWKRKSLLNNEYWKPQEIISQEENIQYIETQVFKVNNYFSKSRIRYIFLYKNEKYSIQFCKENKHFNLYSYDKEWINQSIVNFISTKSH